MAEIITETATFLFTDIEESTRLVKERRGRYVEVLAEHRRLLREAFVTRDGREIDTQGDAFFYVFRTPRDAVLAAVDAQRAIASYHWPDSTEVRVRMAIHTGGAALAEDRYHGIAVHRAARMCAAAHGGQILVSQTTRSLLEDEEELPDIGFRDLGEHRLKGFDRPDRVHQVVTEGLESAFPPLRTFPAERLQDTRQEQLAAAAGERVVVAEDEARALGHDFLATEHLLLAVLREKDGLGARVLQSLGVSWEHVRRMVAGDAAMIQREKPTAAQLTLTPRAQRVLEIALHEALARGDEVGGEHVLLGIARETECIAARILLEFGVDADTIQREIGGNLKPSEALRRGTSRRRFRSIWRPPRS